MRKYLLIIKKQNLITYEVYTSYDELLNELYFIREIVDQNIKAKWFKIDNMDLKKCCKIFLTFTDFMKGVTHGE